LRDVVLVSPTSGGLGGVAQHVRGLAWRLASDGYGVEIISSSSTPIVRVKGLMNPSFALSSLLKGAGTRCRVAHAHSIPSAPAMRALRADLKVLTLHGYYSEQVKLLHGGAVGSLVSWFERTALGWADIVTAVSKSSVEVYHRMGFDVKYIPNAVDLTGLPREGWRIFSPQVVFVGRLSYEKGLDTLLEAAEKAGNLNFLIVGWGPYGLRLRARSSKRHNIRFVGEVSHHNALRYIAGSDVLVLPSYMEGLSTVILEAMALKVPVVATRVGGNTELVEDGVTGLLVSPKNPDELADALERIVSDKILAARLSDEAFRRVVAEYSWGRVYREYLRIYGLEGGGSL
jgi:glycosyltransferase involved in cell wall biosynthesis